MKRLLALLAVLALVLAACGSSSDSNAFVLTDDDSEDDLEIPRREVSNDEMIEQLEAVADSDDFVAELETGGSPVTGDGVAGLDPAYVAQFVGERIIFELITGEVDARGLDVTDEDRDAGEAELATRLGQGDVEAGQTILDSMPESYREFLVDSFADVSVLMADIVPEGPDEEELRAFYDENPDQFEQACGAHILIATSDPATGESTQTPAEAEAEAEDIKSQLEGGADFAELATAESDDTGSGAEGGDLGCAPKGSYVPEFEDALFGAEPDEIVGPVETEFGFHLIRLDELQDLSFEDARPQIEQQLAPQTDEFGTFVQTLVQSADVVLDDRYGTWNAETGTVDPPGTDSTTTTLPPIGADETLPPVESLPPAETVPPGGG